MRRRVRTGPWFTGVTSCDNKQSAQCGAGPRHAEPVHGRDPLPCVRVAIWFFTATTVFWCSSAIFRNSVTSSGCFAAISNFSDGS